MNPQARYPFLEILRESEGLARGANLSDKISHTVYKTMQTMSSVAHVRRLDLFTLNVAMPEIVNLTRKDLAAVVARLMGDRMVTQIFRLEYVPGQPAPNLVSCFITQPIDEKINAITLYNENVMASVQALESLLDGLPAVTPDAVRLDCEADLQAEARQRLQLPATIVDLFSAVHASKFDMVPPPELVQRTIEDIQSELLRRAKIIELINYGLMPLRDAEVLPRLETATDFLLEKVVPKYRSRGSLKRMLETIGLEESTYFLDEFVPQTAEFAMRRADLIKRTLQGDPQYKGGRLQGGLAIETILTLGPLSKSKYQDAFEKENSRRYREIRDALAAESNDWQRKIQFYSDDELDNLPPEVLRMLRADGEILYGTWHRRDGLLHIFVHRHPDTFRLLVRGMMALPPERHYQVLAMKALLESNEGQFPYLFEDPNFVAAYGRLLRQVYLSYIPWYLRIFLAFGLNWFQDASFQIAKKTIQSQQGELALRNEQRREERKQAREEEQKRKLQKIREASLANKIVEQLDAAYFEKNRIPSVGEILEDLNGQMEEATFEETVRRENFKTVAMSGKDAGPRDAVLLYPMNHEWRTRVARLRRVLDRVFQLNPPERGGLQLERARKVQKFLSKVDAGGAAESPPDGDDPYGRFQRELEKHEARSGGGPGPSDDGE